MRDQWGIRFQDPRPALGILNGIVIGARWFAPCGLVIGEIQVLVVPPAAAISRD